MQKEPLVAVGAATSLVAAVIAVLVAFGVPMTGAQTEAILALVAVAGPIVLAALARSRVYSPASVEAIRAERAE